MVARKKLSDAGPIVGKKRKSVQEMIAGEARAPGRGSGGDVVVTTFRLERHQWEALRREAMRLALEGGGGSLKPDASMVLRGIVEDWIKAGSPPPKGTAR